jgi:hypothetical protein
MGGRQDDGLYTLVGPWPQFLLGATPVELNDGKRLLALAI